MQSNPAKELQCLPVHNDNEGTAVSPHAPSHAECRDAKTIRIKPVSSRASKTRMSLRLLGLRPILVISVDPRSATQAPTTPARGKRSLVRLITTTPSTAPDLSFPRNMSLGSGLLTMICGGSA